MNNEILLTLIALAVMVAVAVWVQKYLKPEPVTKVADEQLRQARILALKHRAAAEEHEAMADMLDSRVKRLESVQPTKVEVMPASFTFHDTQFGGL